MNRRSTNFESSAWIVGGLLGTYLLIFGAILLDEWVFKSEYTSRLPGKVQEALRTAYFPIVYPLYRLGIIP